MHEATVTASSCRRDGKGFKTTLPEYGEVWMNLADADIGKIEYRQTYKIAFTVNKTPKGTFYDVKRIDNPSSPKANPQPNVPALNGGAQAGDIGPHVGMWEKEAFDALRAGMTSSQIIQMGIEARQVARLIVRANLEDKLPETLGLQKDPNDSLDF